MQKSIGLYSISTTYVPFCFLAPMDSFIKTEKIPKIFWLAGLNAEKGAEETKERAKPVARNGGPYTRKQKNSEEYFLFLSFPLNIVGFVKVKASTFRTLWAAFLGDAKCVDSAS